MTTNNTSIQCRMNLHVDQIFLVCLAIFPLFFLSLDGWMSGIFFFASVLASYILIRDKIQETQIIPDYISRPWVFLIMAALASPLLAIFLGQLFRQDFSWPYYDSPSRLLFSILILLVITQKRINTCKLFEYSIPATIFISLASILIKPGTVWEPSRITTYFVDPLTFGSISITFGLASLVSIDLLKRDTLLLKLYKFAGFATGIYLSILSGSRTGWLALPIVLMIWCVSREFKHKTIIITLTGIMTLIASIMVYHYSSVVHEKINLAFSEVFAYQWDALNLDNSLAMRISFWRMAIYFFEQNPLGGWGDTSFKILINATDIARFASQYTREFALHSGFHNEIMTNMVRSGIWGLLSSIAVLFIPLCFFIRQLFSPSILTQKMALFSLCYMICTVISSMSTEVLNLKFTTAFHAMMISCLCGSLLITTTSDKERKNQ
jgi:O-antigen ligase